MKHNQLYEHAKKQFATFGVDTDEAITYAPNTHTLGCSMG